MKLFTDANEHVKADIPHFEMKLVVTGIKILGKAQMSKALSDLIEGKKYSDLISGFDMTNEEDFSSPVLEFINEIKAAKLTDNKEGLNCFLRGGETHDRYNDNIYDAILLNSKRIGHCLSLQTNPYLQ